VNDGRELSGSLKDAVVGLGGSFMISSEAKAAGKDGGYKGWALYMTGRAGVLGDAPAPVVSAALGFLEPTMVETAWESGRAVAPVGKTVELYAGVCRAWGQARWGALDGMEKLADLLGKIAAEVEPAGLPLFAGWRSLPLPDEPAERTAQLLQVLREHRGGAHLIAVRSVGLPPLQSILAGSGGVGNARFFGWPEPFPEIDGREQAARAEAERLTTELVAPAYGVLDNRESQDLAELLTVAQRRAREHDA
jgi:helix-turn-helix protein